MDVEEWLPVDAAAPANFADEMESPRLDFLEREGETADLGVYVHFEERVSILANLLAMGLAILPVVLRGLSFEKRPRVYMQA